MADSEPVVLAQYAARNAIGKVAAVVNALAKIMRRMPSELRARFRSKAEERMLDELLDRIASGSVDQDDSDPVGAGEDQGPLMLIGLLIGVLAVWVLIAMLALLSS